MSKSSQFLNRMHSDFEGPFPKTRQDYRYYIFFLEESIGLVDIEPLKFKDDAFDAFKNYKTLQKKQSGCQLKVLNNYGGGDYMGVFGDYLQENCISHGVTSFYLLKQNKKGEMVKCIIIGHIQAIPAQQKLPKLL